MQDLRLPWLYCAIALIRYRCLSSRKGVALMSSCACAARPWSTDLASWLRTHRQTWFHERGALSNKGMKLTKLSPAPGRMERRLMPAPSQSDAGTALQLIPGVGPTAGWRALTEADAS